MKASVLTGKAGTFAFILQEHRTVTLPIESYGGLCDRFFSPKNKIQVQDVILKALSLIFEEDKEGRIKL